jgi:hydroxyquinol 1,2-dioxygenase
MIDFDENTITDAVLAQIADTPDGRLREVLCVTIKHVHEIVRETGLTRPEWNAAIDFLTAVGKACTAEHQEFMLLSDTCGVTTLMNLLEDRRGVDRSTYASVLGPFYRDDAPELPLGASVAMIKTGEEAVMYGRVMDAGGAPVAGAVIDIWLADEEGAYDVQAHGPGVSDLRGRFRSDADGLYYFRTTIPLGYSVPMGGPVGRLIRATARAGMRPAHVHLRCMAPDFRELVTSVYFQADPYLQTDAAFGVTPDLVVRVEPPSAASPCPALPRIVFDCVLSRDTD